MEGLIRFETAQLIENVAEYKSEVLSVWTRYMKLNCLPYLSGPISIVKTRHMENDDYDDDRELSAIMTFVKYQWDILYSKCPYARGHYNLIGFLAGKNKCNCTCITALLIVTADCIGLFPQYIMAQVTRKHIYVVTHRGLVIERSGDPGDNIVRVPTSYGIRSFEDFIRDIAWYKKNQDLYEKILGEAVPNFENAMSTQFSNVTTMTDEAFVIKWIKVFSRIDKFEKYYDNRQFIWFYEDYLLLYQKHHNSMLFKNSQIPHLVADSVKDLVEDLVNNPDESSNQDRYRMLFFLTVIYLNINSEQYTSDLYNMEPEQSSAKPDEYIEYIPDVKITKTRIIQMKKSYNETFEYDTLLEFTVESRRFMKYVRDICHTFKDNSSRTTNSTVFKKFADENFEIIIRIWGKINATIDEMSVEYYIPGINSNYIPELIKLRETCFVNK